MSTRAVIGRTNPDKTITYIYLHNDGYPEYAGTILRDHYTDEDKIKRLLELGDLSIIGLEPVVVQRDEQYEIENGFYNKCGAYGEDNNTAKNLDEYLDKADGMFAEYVYLYEDGHWRVYDYTTKGYMELAAAVSLSQAGTNI